MAFVNPPSWTPVVSQTKFFEPVPFSSQNALQPTGWYLQWTDPIPVPNQPITESVTWVPFVPAQVNLGWYEPWSVPNPQQAGNFQESVTWVPINPNAPANTSGPMGWFEPFSVPVTLQPRSDSGTISWVPLGSPKINLGWYVQWQNPVYQSVSAYLPASQWIPFVPSAGTLTPTQIGWFESWSVPVTFSTPLMEGLVSWNPFVPPAPPPTIQNYINTGTNNYISQRVGEGVEF